MKDYSDIINLKHHTSKIRIPMPIERRAAQFAPFSALRGFEAVLEQTAKRHDTVYNNGKEN